MRTSKISREEMEATQRAADDRTKNRNAGFSLMHVRDSGSTRLSNGVYMAWPSPSETKPDLIAYTHVPEGHFMLHIEGKNYYFDADEFQKWLRWV